MFLQICHGTQADLMIRSVNSTLQRFIKRLSIADHLNLKFQDSVWNFVFGTSASESSHSDLAGKVNLSGDTMVTILCMVKYCKMFRKYDFFLILWYIEDGTTSKCPLLFTISVLLCLGSSLVTCISDSKSYL
jgi:hypothetical protein